MPSWTWQTRNITFSYSFDFYRFITIISQIYYPTAASCAFKFTELLRLRCKGTNFSRIPQVCVPQICKWNQKPKHSLRPEAFSKSNIQPFFLRAENKNGCPFVIDKATTCRRHERYWGKKFPQYHFHTFDGCPILESILHLKPSFYDKSYAIKSHSLHSSGSLVKLRMKFL